MKRYTLRHFIRYTLWVLILLLPFCASFNTSLATGIGSVLSLDGNGDEVRVQHSQSLVLTDALTIEAWIHPLGPGSGGAGGNGGIIVNKEGEYELGRFGDGSIRFAVSNADPGWNWINTDFIAPEGAWTHLAFTYSANTQIFQLFADGVLVDSRTGRGTIGDVHETHNFFKIGARREGSGQFFDGEIDEVRVWNIVRPVTEIQARMNTSLQGNESGLVGYWNFDNGTANDRSNHSNHGTLRGDAAIVPSTAGATPTGQVAISAVPSINNPAVGDTIEVSINIAGGSNVAGYDFTLTFDPAQLQYISIENADYLPPGAFATPPTVASGSVQFAVAAVTGTGEGNGTLAVATFKVLAATRTTIGLEQVTIGDQTAQLLPIASITGTTISPTTATTETQVHPPTVPSTTPPTTSSSTTSTTSTGQLTISAVPSVNNPAVGDTIEVSINIAGGSNVAGYDFTLTFDPAQLQYISIENADYLPPGAFATPPTVASGSVQFAVAAVTGTGEGNGTLAVATFKVLAATRTTIGLEQVTIGDAAAQPIAIASITGATINPTTSTTETQVVTPTVPSTTTPTTGSSTPVFTPAGHVAISAVPSISNPAVGNTIEVSINIAGGSDVAGYGFTLTFNPTQLQYIGIENADYLPPGTFVPDATVGSGSVSLYAAAARGMGEGDGTLAVATFKVLVDTETTIRFEAIEVGDQNAQPLGIASVIGATINRAAPTVDTEVEYLLSIPAGTNLIHVPLRVTAVDGTPRTIASIADLYDALGGGSTVDFLITYDPRTQEWRSYFGASDTGTPADKILADDTGILAGMKTRVSVRLRGSALGTNGNGVISLNPGLNVVGLPLRNSRVMRVSDLFALSGIGGNVPVIILTDSGEFKAVGRAGDPGDIEITGGQSFIMTAQRPATVIIDGDAWTNIR